MKPCTLKIVLFVVVLALAKAAAVKAETPPNIVVIIGDDQHWGDYGFMGHPSIKTPNIDRLARRSVVFKRGYVAAPICRPSLASLVTGRYPFTHGVTGNDVNGYQDRAELDKPLREAFHKRPSFVRLLTENGYLSHQSGKWWEGSYQDGGFSHGMTHGDPKRGGRHGDAGLKIGRQGLKPIFEFVDHAVTQKKPFLLWYAPFLPHTPHNPPQRLLEKYQAEDRPPSEAKYFAMCDWFDETCGQLLDHLEEQGLSENTLVLFICDNGWATVSSNQADPNQKAWNNYALRTKGSPFEGGIRTPILVSWPAKLKPEESPDLAHAIDFLPTIVEAAGLTVPDGLPGINLLDPSARQQRKRVFGVTDATHNISIGNPNETIHYLWCVEGDWKLMIKYPAKDTTRYKNLHLWDARKYRLYNIAEDPNEKVELSEQHPEIVERLKRQIENWHSVENSQ